MNNNPMDFNEVAIFIKVVQKGSFTGAARALEMPKSTVSTKVSSLEARMGVSLITRTTRKIRLTPAGEAFYLRSMKAIDEIMAAELAVRSENIIPQGRFRITAPVDVGNTILPHLAANFLKKFPGVELEIQLSDHLVNFLEEDIDLAIRAGDLKDSSLIAKKVGEVVFNLYASPKYLKVKGRPATLKDLNLYRCIIFKPHSNEWVLTNRGRSSAVSLNDKMAVNNMSLARSMALEGVGIALLPSFLCEAEVKSKTLEQILPDWSTKVSPLYFVYPNQKYVSPIIRAFIESSQDLLRERFKINK